MLEKISHSRRRETIEEDYQVKTLLPGLAIDSQNSSLGTIARIDHISLRSDVRRPFQSAENHDILTYVINGELQVSNDSNEVVVIDKDTHLVMNAMAMRPSSAIVGRQNNQDNIEFIQVYFLPNSTTGKAYFKSTQQSNDRHSNQWRWLAGEQVGLPLTLSGGSRVYDIHLKAGEFTKLPVMTGFDQKSMVLYILSGSISLNDHYLSLTKGDTLFAQGERPNILAREDSKLLLIVTDKTGNQ